jgi:hypothetical protein
MDDKPRVRVDTGYPLGQLARALTTAAVHEDPATRRRAEERVRRWEAVLAGMATGTVTVGSRTPVKGLPAWATLEVVRGGFATGGAVAGGPLRDHEADLARRAGLPPERQALFSYHLSERGIAELGALLDTGRYRVEVPEEAALPVVAWLLRAGDRSAALDLLDELALFADRLRFAPAPGEEQAPDPAGAPLVHRETVAKVRAAVARRRPNERVEARRPCRPRARRSTSAGARAWC